MTAKVADFGTARSLAPTIAGRTVDNPIWLAPEVMRNEEYTEKVCTRSHSCNVKLNRSSSGGCLFLWHYLV